MKKIKLADFLNIEDKRSYIKGFIKNNSIEIIISYLSNFNNTKELREIVFLICDLIKLDGKIRNRIILITDELNNNAIEYGSRLGDENKLKIIIKEKSEGMYINIEVIDSGRGPETKDSLEMNILGEKKLKDGFKGYNSIRGRGLFMIVVNLVDNLYFKDSKDGGLIVGIEKFLKN